MALEKVASLVQMIEHFERVQMPVLLQADEPKDFLAALQEFGTQANLIIVQLGASEQKWELKEFEAWIDVVLKQGMAVWLPAGHPCLR